MAISAFCKYTVVLSLAVACAGQQQIDPSEVIRIEVDGSTSESSYTMSPEGAAQRVGTQPSRRSPLYTEFKQTFAAYKQRVGAAEPIIPYGRSIELPADTLPRALALCPSRRAVITIDAMPHGNLNKDKSFSFLYAKKPYPWAYLIAPSGELTRKLEFADRQVLPYGIAEAGDGRVGITFYTAIAEEARVEVWDRSLESKLTFHEYSLKPALPTFDSDGLLWVPYTILDRLNEEHPTVIGLWVYKPDGGRWEVFPRRQLQHVRFPHTVSIDNAGRIFLTGLAGPKWPYVDDTYGLAPRPDLDITKAVARIDVYTLVKDPSDPAYVAEQKARWQEMNGGWDKAGEPPNSQAYAHIRPTAALKLHRSYAFPYFCVQTLLALTGDGYALAACHGGSKLSVLRLGRPGLQFATESASQMHHRKGSGEGILRGAGTAAPTYATMGQAVKDQLTSSASGMPGASTLEDSTEVVVDLDDSDGPEAGPTARVVVELDRPFGVADIGSIQMDPSGTAFALLDRARRRVMSVPWPLITDESVDDSEGATGSGVGSFTLPSGKTRGVKITW